MRNARISSCLICSKYSLEEAALWNLFPSVIDLIIQNLFICMICFSLATIQGNFPLPACGFQGNERPLRHLVALRVSSGLNQGYPPMYTMYIFTPPVTRNTDRMQINYLLTTEPVGYSLNHVLLEENTRQECCLKQRESGLKYIKTNDIEICGSE